MPYTPILNIARLQPLLDELEVLRAEIGALDVPTLLEPWLRQQTEARGAHMSTSIEGNPMTEPEVRELFAGPGASSDRVERENLDYRDGARFARQVADDQSTVFDAGLLRAFHFLAVHTTDRYDSAGQFRNGQNVVRDASGGTAYMPPPPGKVAGRVSDMIAWLQPRLDAPVHPLIRAAVSHLEFVSIHPFDDGNGRTARLLTVHFAARGGWNMRGFVTSEAAFGRNRMRYYDALQRQQGGRYPIAPSPDVTGWCEWVLRRFAIEAATAIGVVTEWGKFLNRLQGSPWARHFGAGSMYLALTGSASRSEYVRANGVSPATAVSHLNFMVQLGIARRIGRGRSTRYVIADDSGAQDIPVEAYEDAIARFPEP